MADETTHAVTQALKAWGEGGAEERIWPLVYDELQRMASRQLRRERSNHTLQPSALVHEAYLKLVDQRQARFEDRKHFFAIAAKIMRRILVDHERSRRYAKRGGGQPKVPLDHVAGEIQLPAPELVAVDEALVSLERLEPMKAKIVELRFFVGLSYREAAEVLGCSEKTVQRHWRLARTWLYRELSKEPEDPES
jgi:RNA polymerase sigma factor (TIGR02999 family)